MRKLIIARIFVITFFYIAIPPEIKCQWNIVYSTDTFLTAVNFISEDTGFVGGIGLLEMTTDGGSHWSACSGFSGENHVWDIDFASSDLFFLSHFDWHPVWTSTDAGLNWENIPDIFVGGPIYDIDVVNDTISYGGGDGGFIYYTKDGFDILYIHNVGAADIYSISFPSIDTGYIAGGVDAFLKTENGADSWIDINFSSIFNATLLDFCSPSTGYVTDGYDLYKTTNYGETWDLLTIPFPMNRIIGLECVNNLVCYISGDDPFLNIYILKTIDGGETWVNTSFDSFVSPPNKIVCLNDSVCYSISSNGLGSEFYLLKTINGGGIDTSEVNISNPIVKKNLLVYPNPASDYITIEIGNELMNANFEIISADGKIILVSILNSNTTQINLTDFPSGIFYLRIINTNIILNEKIIVN